MKSKLSEREMARMYKVIRPPYTISQFILLFFGGYLLLIDSEYWSLPLFLFFLSSIIYWSAYIYYRKKG